jgi:flagellar protein FliS
LQQGNIGPRGEAISKAMGIIAGGLQASLNKDVGGDLAHRLNALYDYMLRRLLQANLEQNEALLVEVDNLLATLEEAWIAIGGQAGNTVAEGAPAVQR